MKTFWLKKALVALTLALLGAAALRSNAKQILLTFVPTQDHSTIWVQPMLAPVVEVKVLEGKAPSKDRRTIMCTQIYRDKHSVLADGSEATSHVVVFLCEDGTALEMTNVYFGEVK
jgi:hypothetical protein